MNKNLNKAIKIIRNGGIIIFPTDTAFGIGCRIDDRQAVARLFRLRRRPSEKAVPILVASIEMAEKYAIISPSGEDLVKKYWPGGLTIVVNNKEVPSKVIGGGKTVGLRMPNHSSALMLIKKVGVPIIGCSANFAGEATPYNMSDLNPELVKLVDFVLSGRTSIKKSSTVVDCSNNKLKVLREGAVKVKN